MISCQTFRANLTPGTNDAELLEHLRSCDLCLDHAAGIDPDLLFRSLGGQELVPAGGVDAFTEEVMHEIQLRATEQKIARPRLNIVQRLSIAATLVIGVTGAALVWQHGAGAISGDAPLVAQHPPVRTVAAVAAVTTKPVVETYDSKNATIVEVPAEDANNVKVVMIFDEKLPADL